MRWLCLFLTLCPVAWATTYRDLSLDELITRTEIAFFGEVTGVTVEDRDGSPYTLVTFGVSRALLGDPGDSETLAFYGGKLPDGRSLEVEGMPAFTDGDEVLILAYDAPYYSPIVGFSQGLWRARPDGFEDETGRLLSLDEDSDLARDGDGGDRNDVLDALEARLEAAQ